MPDGLSKGGGSSSEGAGAAGHLSMLLQELARAPGDDLVHAWQQRLKPGDNVGRFEILREIGRGGFGVVYEALDRELGRSVAFKTLRPARTGQELSSDWIRKEAEAVARLDHPAIVTLHDVGRCASGPYLVEELLHGETLEERLRRGPLPAQEAVAVGLEIAKGLAHAHGHGVLHRDLKPGNVFLTEDGRVKLIDFGLAHLLGTRGLHGAGTPAYMAPEQLRGEAADARADVFALGATLFKALTGKSPFEVKEGRSAALDGGAPPALPEGTPAPLARLVEQCLSQDPVKRPASGQAVSEELLAVQRSLARPEDEGREAPRAVLSIWFQELRRRRVLRALIGWGIVSFAVLQVIESVMHGLHLPEWTLSVVLVALGIGFPIAGILAWVFDLKATGVELTRPAPAGAAGALHPRGVRLALVLVGLGLVAAAPGVVHFLSVRGRGRSATGEARPVIRSIAVLPLASLSTDPEQQYFADGMTDAIITELARTAGLRVVSRGSVLRFKDSQLTTPDIARALDVEAVVEGTVQRASGRVRVTAQLVHGPSDRNLWAETYERDLGDVLQLQGDVARAIAESVLGKLPAEDRTRFATGRRVDPEAYDAYLRGRYLWGQRSDEALARAIASLGRALAIDPSYAAAWAALADCYIYLRIPPRESMPKARDAALRAIALDPGLAEAHVALGNVRFLFDWDFKGAEEELDRAIALNPASVEAHHQRSHVVMAQGRFADSLRESERALALDPLALAINIHLAYHLIQARRFDAAADQARRTLELDAAFGTGHAFLGRALLLGGKPQEAIAELRRATELGGYATDVEGDLTRAYVLTRRPEEARATLARIRADAQRRYVGAGAIALAHLALDERDEAFLALDRSLDERDVNSVYLAVDPRWDALRPDPRFQASLRRVGLPER